MIIPWSNPDTKRNGSPNSGIKPIILKIVISGISGTISIFVKTANIVTFFAIKIIIGKVNKKAYKVDLNKTLIFFQSLKSVSE